MSGWYVNPVGGYGVVTASAVALLVAMLLTNRDLRRLKPSRRWTLVGLRVAVFLLIIAAMLRPTRIFTDTRQKPATLIVLVDRSKSMLTPHAFGDQTRWDAVKKTVDEARTQLGDMGEGVEVKIYSFDRETSPVEFTNAKLGLGKTAAGAQTAIGAALDDV